MHPHRPSRPENDAAVALTVAPLPARIMASIQHKMLDAGHTAAMTVIGDDEVLIANVIERATDLARFLIDESLKAYDGVAIAATARQVDVLRWTYVKGFARIRSAGEIIT